MIITQAIVSTMNAPEQHVLQQPRPCSWVSVSVDVDSGVHVVMLIVMLMVTVKS